MDTNLNMSQDGRLALVSRWWFYSAPETLGMKPTAGGKGPERIRKIRQETITSGPDVRWLVTGKTCLSHMLCT